MIKKLIKSLVTGLCVFAATFAVAYFVYNDAYKKSIQTVSEQLMPTEQEVTAEQRTSSSEVIESDYFLARYDGKNLVIYSVSSGKEEFLYTLDARVEDISEAELNGLKNGIILADKQALASFEEDFTS